MMKVSIVIPCYNAEKYICQCIDSLLAQTHDDLDLICVDDCSTDRTWSILNEYVAKDSRIRIFKLEQNSGSARKPLDLGISKVLSDFVCLIGNDDYVEETFLGKLVCRQDYSNADIVLGRVVFFNGSNMWMHSLPDDSFDFDQILNGKEAVMLTINGWKIGANGALIRKKLLNEQRENSSALEMIQMNADEYDTRALLIMADKVAFADAYYHYRKHSESITENIDKSFEMLITDKMLVDLFERTFGKKSDQFRRMEGDFLNSIVCFYIRYKRKKASLKNPDRAFYLIKSHFAYLSNVDIYPACSKLWIKFVLISPFFIFRFLISSLLMVQRCLCGKK